MRVLVTGVAGFVGGHLMRRLHARGDAVLGLGAEPAPTDGRAPLAGEWVADLRDARQVLAALDAAKPDAVVHLAAQSSAARSFEAPEETFAANVLGTWHVLEAVRGAAPAARVLAIGTGEAYGPQPPGTRVAESAPFRPVSPYGLSKATADAVCEAACHANGLDVVRVRAFGHAGVGQSPRFFLAGFARQIAEIEAGAAEPVLKTGNLDVVRDLTDVEDIVDAYVQLLERGVRGRAYNVCRGEGVALADVAGELCRRASVPVRTVTDPARMRPADVAYLVGDPSRIESEIGWRASRPLAATLDAVLAEWRATVARGPAAGERP